MLHIILEKKRKKKKSIIHSPFLHFLPILMLPLYPFVHWCATTSPFPPVVWIDEINSKLLHGGKVHESGGGGKKESFAKLWFVTYFVSLPWHRVLFQSAWFALIVIHSWRTCFRKFTSLDPIILGSRLPSQYSIALRVNNPQSWLPWDKNKCVHHLKIR